MLKKNRFIKILLVSLLTISHVNLLSSSLSEKAWPTITNNMSRSNSNYHNILIKIMYTNMELYDQLAITQEKFGSCIKQGKENSGIQIITTGDNVFLSLDSKSIAEILSNPEDSPPINIENKINKQYNEYIQEKTLQANQKKILSIIKDLAPELHKKIIEFDPDGSKHIIAGDGLAVRCITDDGLPIIKVDANFINESTGYQRAGIAHELGHYALEHLVMRNTTYNENSGEAFTNKLLNSKKTDAIQIKSSQKGLDPNKAMTDAYVRTYEYEADRFAMINMGVSFEDAESMIKSFNDSTKGCRTFTVDHPLDENRLKQFQAIKVEMELLKNSPSAKPAPINWDNVQYDTLKYSWYTGNIKLYPTADKQESFEIIFEQAIAKYLPHMLPKAQAEMQAATPESGIRREYSNNGMTITTYDKNNKIISKRTTTTVDNQKTETILEADGTKRIAYINDENQLIALTTIDPQENRTELKFNSDVCTSEIKFNSQNQITDKIELLDSNIIIQNYTDQNITTTTLNIETREIISKTMSNYEFGYDSKNNYIGRNGNFNEQGKSLSSLEAKPIMRPTLEQPRLEISNPIRPTEKIMPKTYSRFGGGKFIMPQLTPAQTIQLQEQHGIKPEAQKNETISIHDANPKLEIRSPSSVMGQYLFKGSPTPLPAQQRAEIGKIQTDSMLAMHNKNMNKIATAQPKPKTNYETARL